MKNIIKKTILFFIIFLSLLISLYFCEIYLKNNQFHYRPAFLDFTSMDNNNSYVVDPELVYKANNNGYRTPIEMPTDKTQKNVAFIGDSATYGYGAEVETTYPITFGKIYNTSHPLQLKPLIIYNFGIDGFSLDQEYLLTKRDILIQFKPKILVWNINVNDMWDTNFMCLVTKKDNQWIKIPAYKNISYWYGWFKIHLPKPITNSKLFNFTWYQFADRVTHGSGDDRYTIGCSTTQWNQVTWDNILEKLDYFIGDLNNELKKTDSQLIVTLIPYQKYFDNRSDLYNLDPAYLLLKNNLQKQDINFIDYNEIILNQLDPQFYQQNRVTNQPITTSSSPESNLSQQYFLDGNFDSAPDNWRHPNQKMYDLMAQTLFEYIDKLKLTL